MGARAGTEPDWDGVRLHVVTGKGGTGKSTVSAALALALASRGATVLLCEVEDRQAIAQLFDVPPLPYEETRLVAGPDGHGEVYALAVEAEAAFMEYLTIYYRLGRAGRLLDRFGVVDFATTVAPGMRDVLMTGKVYEAVHRSRRTKHARQYDAVVLDAPPTGRIAAFLNVNRELAGLAKVGPIRHQADNVTRLLHSELTRVHLVTLLEDMPVQETVDGIEELRGSDLPVGGIVVNQVRPDDLPSDRREEALAGALDRSALAEGLAHGGVDPTDELVDGLLALSGEHAERMRLEDEQRKAVADLGLPTYELARRADGVDLGALYELAADLCAQGMA